jgi:hypothetical protein
MRTRPLVVGGIALLVVLIYPFKVTVAPEWNVKVVDQNGNAVAGAYVSEFGTNWTLNVHHEDAACSDALGRAYLARHTVRASFLTRASRFVSGFGPHASLGPDVKIGVEGFGYGDMPNDITTSTWDGIRNRVSLQFVLHKCPQGFTGYKCSADYDYFFKVNSDARKMAACQSAR